MPSEDKKAETETPPPVTDSTMATQSLLLLLLLTRPPLLAEALNSSSAPPVLPSLLPPPSPLPSLFELPCRCPQHLIAFAPLPSANPLQTPFSHHLTEEQHTLTVPQHCKRALMLWNKN